MSNALSSSGRIPDQLLNNIKKGDCVLFLGADLPRDVTGLPSRADLAREMAQRYHLDESLSLAEVAQRVSQAGNRFEFTDFIRNALDTAGKSPAAFHQGVVALVKEHDIKTIITTAYDNLLEVAFQQAGVGLNRVVRGSDVSFIRPDRPTLIKLYGDAQQPDTLVVTDRDHSQLLRDRDKEDVIDEVRRAFKRNTILFYGYNLSDPDFKFLFDQIAGSKFARLAYAVWPPKVPETDVQMWRDRGIVILEEDPLGVLSATSNVVRRDPSELSRGSDLIPPQIPRIVALKTYHDFFVTLDPSHAWMLVGNAEPSTAERFALLHLSNGKFALKASHGRYVTASLRGRWALTADAQNLGEAQQFTLNRLEDGRVVFQTIYNRYVTAMDDQPDWHWELRAETDEIRAWEKFTLVPIGDMYPTIEDLPSKGFESDLARHSTHYPDRSSKASRSIDVQTLRIDAAVPESVVVERVFDLAVAVRQKLSPLLAVKDLKHVESGEVQTTWEAGTPLINLRLEVDAPDCEIEGKHSILFRLVRGADSPLFYFRLKPLRVGDLSIVVTVYQEDYWLGSARVNTVAADQSTAPAGQVQITVASQPLWLDCEIRVHDRSSAGHKVELTLNSEQVVEGWLSADAASFVPTGDPRADGQQLFDLLFADLELREAWGEARGRSPQRRMRLRIDPRELRGLPWELLRNADDLLAAAADTPFSRYLPINQPWGGAIAARPIRVLAVVSNPIDLQAKYGLPQADVELEQRTLREALMPHPPTPSPDSNSMNQERGSAAGVRLTFLAAPITLERLEEELQHGYHIVHFIGHGGFNSKDQQAALYLQNNDNTTHRVADQDFAGMLKRLSNPPQLIVLAACQSATQSLQAAFSGLGPQLVKIGVPAVVAMQDNVTVLTARQFGAKFYRRLLVHGTIDLAMNEARSTLLTNGRYDAAVPVLFMRLRDGRLWGEAPPSAAPQTAATTPTAAPIGRAPLSKEERASLERQLTSARENLRLIEERKAEFVLSTDVDLKYVKEERRWKDRIAELEKALGLTSHG